MIHFIERFATYKLAKKAEIIAQEHSTITSFENSYSTKGKLRQRPNVFNSSSSESECKDFKNIDKLSEADAGLVVNKKYNYNRNNNPNTNDVACSSTNQLTESGHFSGSVQHQACENDDNNSMNGSSNADLNENSNEINNENSFEIQNINEDDVDFHINDDEVDFHINADDDNFHISEDDVNFPVDDIDQSQQTENESNFLSKMNNNLESTNELRSLGSSYDFSDDRCLLRIEKLTMHVCQEVESIKAEIQGLKKGSNETESVVQKLVLVCKDLAVEVFACTDEIKKRNGMFTDLLVPDIKWPIKKRKQFVNNESALGKHKIIDNVVRPSFRNPF